MSLCERACQISDYDMENQADIIRTQLRRERRLQYEQKILSNHRQQNTFICCLGGFMILFLVIFVAVCSALSVRF